MTSRPFAAFALAASGTILGLAGTDLVLPAIPGLPAVLGGTAATAQLVLVAFIAGTLGGLLLFGELGARFDQRRVLIGSLVVYGLVSAAAALAPTVEALIALRLVQGAAGSAPAVFAPGILRASFDEHRAMRAIGWLGSIESLVPALAPLAGAALLAAFDWRASFVVIGALALAVAALSAAARDVLPTVTGRRGAGSYLALVRDPIFVRYALSQATTLGAVLIFVFGAPAVITHTMGGTLRHFIIMQVVSVGFFIVGANLTGALVSRVGPERMIVGGTALSAAGALGLLGYALAGGDDPRLLAPLAMPMSLGLGLRGPPGFFRAVIAARGDDARGAALVIVAILGVATAGGAVVAPLITHGLVALAAVAAVTCTLGLVALVALPKLPAT